MKETSITSPPKVVLYMRTATGGPGALFVQRMQLTSALGACPVRMHIRGFYTDVDMADNHQPMKSQLQEGGRHGKSDADGR